MYYFIIEDSGSYRSIISSSNADNLTAGTGEQAYSEDNINAYRFHEDYVYGSTEGNLILTNTLASVESADMEVIEVYASEMDTYGGLKSIWSTGWQSISLSGSAGKTDILGFTKKLPKNYNAGTKIKVRYLISTAATSDNCQLSVDSSILMGALDETGKEITFTGSSVQYVEKFTPWVEFNGTNLTPNTDVSFPATRDADDVGNVYLGALYILKAEIKYNY